MENVKQKLENFKNYPIEQFLKKDSYINIILNENIYQGYIKEIKSGNKYDIIYLDSSDKILPKTNLTTKEISFFGCYYLQNNNNIREIYLNPKFNEIEQDTDLNLLILNKLRELYIDINILNNEIEKFDIYKHKYIFENLSELEKNNPSLIIQNEEGEEFNITGYYTMQFFSGIFIDVIIYVNKKLSILLKESIRNKEDFTLNEELIKIINLLLNLIIFVLNITLKYSKIIKESLQINRKIILIDKISSILASIEIILSNVLLMSYYKFDDYQDIEKKFGIICNLCYDIIINNKNESNINNIPIQFFICLINFITSEDNMARIINLDKNKVYKTFLQVIQNLTEIDIKYIKNFSDISNSCINIVKKLYKKEIRVLINNCYYNFLINSLTKCNILEKKISALNCINDIILNMFEKEHEINQIFYEFFFNKNNILNIFFEETVHNEILRRSIELFKYLSTYDKIEGDLIDKLIKLDNNNNTVVRNILCEIIKRIKNVEEKTELFVKITKDFNFDENNNQNNIIDFVTKLTLACFYLLENKADLENDITNGYSSLNNSFSEQNPINDNISFSKKSNIQIVKLPSLLKNNSSYRNNKISRNVSNKSMERMDNIERREVNNNNKTTYNKKVNAKRKYYYGLDMLFKYIIYNYDVKKAKETNNSNITKAIKAYRYILDSTNSIKMNDIYYFLKELLENIQSNKKHNSVVQSLILIEILLNKLQKGNNDKNENCVTNNKFSSISNINNNEETEIIHQLDDKYDIITLISDDLIRYVQDVNNKKNNQKNYKENIFEGIYNYMDNISIRLKLLFIFMYFDLNISDEHLKKLYDLFKSDEHKEERLLLFKEISSNIYNLKNYTLSKIFTEIFENKDEFNRSKFDDEESFLLIKDLFVSINLIKHSFLDDNKSVKVNAELHKIYGIDFLFDILINNRTPLIIQKLCEMLSHYCFYLTSYKKDFASKYWTSFINKITNLMIECNEEKNIKGIYALGKLIESIYHFNFSWRIPQKEDVHEIGDAFAIYQFCCPDRGNKCYKLKVGKKDKFHLMRWKLGYYFDLYVNDVIVCDIDNNKYNLFSDDCKFFDLFPPRKYQKNNLQLELVKVYEEPNQLLLLHNNPSELIENNETIINILIDNLKEENNNSDIIKNNNFFEIKKEIWNILENLPKQKYTELLIKKFDIKKPMEEDDLNEIINFEEIFVLTYNLQCFISYLNENPGKEKEEKEEHIKQKNIFLQIFTNLYHLDKKLYSDFTTKDINKYLNDKKTQFIYYEYTKSLLIIMQIIEEYKTKKNNLIISLTSKEEIHKEKTAMSSLSEFDLDMTKISSIADLKNSVLDIIGYKPLFDKLTNIIIHILNDTSVEKEICSQIIQEIIKLVDSFKDIKNVVNNNYFEFIFSTDILFKKIFIYDFIKSQKDEVKNILSDFLLKNLFESNPHSTTTNLRYNLKEDKEMENKKTNDNSNIKKFFEIILSPEIFSFLVNNQTDGSYFNLISSMIEKYINNKKKIINIQNIQKDIKTIIDLIIECLNDKNKIQKEKDLGLLNYPYSHSANNQILTDNIDKNKRDFINGILLYLLRILELSQDCQPIIDYFLNSIDICDFFLKKGILNKCNHNPLYSEDNPYSNFNLHKIIFQILIFILKYLHNNNKNILEDKKYLDDSLYIKIWQMLNRYHKLEFWKKSKNFEMNFNDKDKKEFIGLKNMSSTCYMNSILQQFFMIPMLRETILSINSDKQDSILYQLQLTFSALKAYEFKYYDPKYFVTVSKLSFYEQMDADEYYGLLVDKLETDINSINSAKNYQTLFKYFFGIKLTDELYFIECNHKRYNESLSYNIQLEVKNYNNINDSLRNYFKTEIMSGDNKIICEECKTKRVCHKKLKLKSLPNILVISLKRFDYDYRTMTKFKLNNYFEFPFELNMSEFLINKNESQEKIDNKNSLYELTGITIHFGVSDYGHYYDLIKAVNNKWYKFNDTNITEFDESEIPKEAFGDKENENNDLESEITDKAEIKEKDNKNAYILIYTKKNFKDLNNSIIKSNNEYNTKLIYPPYNKMSNINQDMKSYINYKMFKYWTLENLADTNYQNFILELLKLDLVKNINKEISSIHQTLIENLKSGGYLPIKNYINTGLTIFSFGLLYFCNILLRSPKEKNVLNLFEEILIVYLENDPKKCIFVLEEFCNFDIIDEFIFSCNKDEVKKEIIELISNAFNNLYEFVETSEEFSKKYVNILVKYINSIIIFIEINKTKALNNITSFDAIAQLFSKLIYKKKTYMNYLKKNAIDKYLNDIINKIDSKQNESSNTLEIKNSDIISYEESFEVNNNINENNFPKLESSHCILNEKTEDFNFGIKFNKNIEITGFKNKTETKKSFDGIAFMKLLLEDIKDIIDN